MIIYRIFLFCVFTVCFLQHTVKAQLLDSLALDTVKEYTSIEEALKSPDTVYKLSLRKQHLKSFPIEIFKFKNLQYLDISKNSIKELPDSIDALVYLQYLTCSKTGLEILPKQIGKLVNLIYLNLNQNDLEVIPPQLGNLQKLQTLDLWSNNFDVYPESLSGLKSLKMIDLRNILISDDTQAYILKLLPNATVYMSPSCKCKW